jgi:hypothetical protein
MVPEDTSLRRGIAASSIWPDLGQINVLVPKPLPTEKKECLNYHYTIYFSSLFFAYKPFSASIHKVRLHSTYIAVAVPESDPQIVAPITAMPNVMFNIFFAAMI